MYNTYLSMIGQIMYVMGLITIVFDIDDQNNYHVMSI